ncbi:hypothetical protein [Butyrivibrio sp. VCD2006]|uniref:hypothetical protein n=1 Tax=Butyrivibrio sp. VCD2006 TaxID=1280664 RepID=UPI00040CF7AE|nr:hypothetical protein [Butyrivibrio sp. VCD2006]
MGKKGKNTVFGNQKNDSQKSKVDRKNDLIQIQKEKMDAELAKDERVAKKLEELEAKEKNLEKEYTENESNLKADYEKRQSALDLRERMLNEQEDKQEKKAKELLDIQAQVKKTCESAVSDEIARIKADERAIREKEKKVFFAEWEAEKAREKKKLEDFIAECRKKAEDELDKAHDERTSAEEIRLIKIREANKVIEEEREKLSEEYKEKIAELSSRKVELDRKMEDIAEQEAELKEESEYLKTLKAKYNQYNEKEVIKLTLEKEHFEQQLEAYAERIKELDASVAQSSTFLLDDNGESMVSKIHELEEQLKEAQNRNDELANMPSKEEVERLRANTKELESVKISLDDEKQKRTEAEAKISAYAMSTRELENARVAAASLESLNNQLQMKLKYISEQYKSTQESKFKVLLDIDKEIENQKIFNPSGFKGSLDELCEYIRNYGATKKGLYYSIDTIRVFMASLAASEGASRLLILQGLSGTGKSSLPRLVAEALGTECKFVPVQPSWRDNRELLGYDNDFTNRFKETEFTKFLYEASALENRNKMYFIVLDEMNLARIEYYFADFLSVLEKPNQSEWIVPLVSGYSELAEDQKPKYLDYSNEAANVIVSNNIWFVGTANNDDSTSIITDKVYDRAQVLDMDSRVDPFKAECKKKYSVDMDEVLGLFTAAKSTTKYKLNKSDKEKIELVDDLLKDMDITFGNRIMSQMEEFVPVYIACGGTKEAAVDYLLTHKILRKLDERYEPYLLNRLETLENGLNTIYGNGVFKQSINKIEKLREKISG